MRGGATRRARPRRLRARVARLRLPGPRRDLAPRRVARRLACAPRPLERRAAARPRRLPARAFERPRFAPGARALRRVGFRAPCDERPARLPRLVARPRRDFPQPRDPAARARTPAISPSSECAACVAAHAARGSAPAKANTALQVKAAAKKGRATGVGGGSFTGAESGRQSAPSSHIVAPQSHDSSPNRRTATCMLQRVPTRAAVAVPRRRERSATPRPAVRPVGIPSEANARWPLPRWSLQ